MSYVTNADIEARLGSIAYVQLTDDAGTGSADEAKVDEARLAAEGEVNSYLARRHAVPVNLTMHPELSGVLRGIVLDLVEYRLHGRRPPVPADVIRGRDDAVRWLQQVAEGRAVLPSIREVREDAAVGLTGRACGRDRFMTSDELADL